MINCNCISLPGTERFYRSDCDIEELNGVAIKSDASSPAIPTAAQAIAAAGRSPLQLRQASPFPLESTNSRRLHYASAQERLRNGLFVLFIIKSCYLF